MVWLELKSTGAVYLQPLHGRGAELRLSECEFMAYIDAKRRVRAHKLGYGIN